MFFVFSIALSYVFNLNKSPNITRYFLLSLIYPIAFISLAKIYSSNSLFRLVIPFNVCMAIILFLSILTTLGIYNFEYYSSDENLLDNYEEISMRDSLRAVSGVYLNQNRFSSVLIIGVYSSILLYLNSYSTKYRISSFILLILSLFFILLTISRSVIFSVVVGLLIYLFFSKLRIINKLIIFTLFLIIILNFILSDYFDIFLLKVSSSGLSDRDTIWKDVFENIKSNLAFGVGLGNYSFSSGIKNFSTHNLYLFFLVSLGFFGSIGIFIFMIWSAFLSVYNLIYNQKNLVAICLACTVITIMLQQTFEVILDNPIHPLSVFFMISVLSIRK